eukprot:2672023-Rhodomonas_salina.2
MSAWCDRIVMWVWGVDGARAVSQDVSHRVGRRRRPPPWRWPHHQPVCTPPPILLPHICHLLVQSLASRSLLGGQGSMVWGGGSVRTPGLERLGRRMGEGSWRLVDSDCSGSRSCLAAPHTSRAGCHRPRMGACTRACTRAAPETPPSKALEQPAQCLARTPLLGWGSCALGVRCPLDRAGMSVASGWRSGGSVFDLVLASLRRRLTMEGHGVRAGVRGRRLGRACCLGWRSRGTRLPSGSPLTLSQPLPSAPPLPHHPHTLPIHVPPHVAFRIGVDVGVDVGVGVGVCVVVVGAAELVVVVVAECVLARALPSMSPAP